MIQELTIPAELNVINITAKSGEPLNNSGDAFGFVSVDDCGNETAFDITTFQFEYYFYEGDCLRKAGGTLQGDLVITDVNKLYFNISEIELLRGKYSYYIKIKDSNSVIKGILNVT